jgi:hypothetical protein
MPRHPSLRTMLFLAATLAGAKVWASDRYHRAIYSDALIAAYGDKARATCQKEIGRVVRGYGNVKLNATNVVIGSPSVKVAMWDMDNPLWEVRYKHPHLLLTAEPVVDLRCAFDVTAGLASLEGGQEAQ